MAIDRVFVGLASPAVGRAGAGGHPCQGVWHRPAGKTPKVGFIATHYNVDFSEHYLASYLAERGYGFLGWNTRFRGNERTFLLDHAVAEIGVGVQWMREEAGVETVVVLGNSGGGSLMAAYQSQAVEPNITPTWGGRPLPAIESLVPGDMFVFLAAHPGRPEIFTNWMDASVVDETDPLSTDKSLDIYHPDRSVPYDRDFVETVRSGQRARNHRITDWAVDELHRLNAAGYPDRLFPVHRVWADPRFVDPTLDANDREPNTCYFGDPQRANRGVFGVGLVNSLRTWLSMWSLEHSQCQLHLHAPRLTVPTLLINASGDSGVFPSDAEAIMSGVAADDKTQVTLPGDHYFLNPGAREAVSDTITSWVEARL